MANLKKIASEVGMDVALVRDILNENTKVRVAKSLADKVFNTARKLGYDLKKLKIGKRLAYRKQTLQELIQHIEGHPQWGRGEILTYMRSGCELVERVQKRTFTEEYGPAGKE
ncbi:MAG: hypothetical protein HYZ53_13685 [Planctomycetes bacterium]|nr:hypothetical protein [Planctomycetota bacterium]